MNKWTIGKRVGAVSALLMALVMCTGLSGMLGMGKMNALTQGLNANYVAGLDKLSRIECLILELRGSTYFAALPQQSPELRKSSLAQVDATSSKMMSLLNEYGTFNVDPEERTLYEVSKAQSLAYLAMLSNFRSLDAAGKANEAMALTAEMTVKRQAMQKALEAEIDFNRDHLVRSVNEVIAIGGTYSGITWFALGFALVAGTLVVVFVVRSVNSSLRLSTAAIRSSAEEVTAASTQVASASESLAQGASQQAASLEETSASGQEISAMTQRNAENSRTAAGLMVQVDDRVVMANKKLEQLISSMGEITSSSERIAKIIKVIDDIAFQTNILALNAAVEAARAGEAGLGFAVVADEVRNLAQRCAQAAKDTTSLIEESVVNARNGGTRLDEVADVIRGITESAAKVKSLVDEVSLGGVEQARGIDQISQALVEMEQTTQQSAASAEESASASQELKAQAASMEAIVQNLESLFQTQTAAAKSRRPVRTPKPTDKTAKHNVVKVAGDSLKAGLLPLQKAIGKSKPVTPAKAPLTVGAPGVDRNSFPLDDSEFKEF